MFLLIPIGILNISSFNHTTINLTVPSSVQNRFLNVMLMINHIKKIMLLNPALRRVRKNTNIPIISSIYIVPVSAFLF